MKQGVPLLIDHLGEVYVRVGVEVLLDLLHVGRIKQINP